MSGNSAAPQDQFDEEAFLHEVQGEVFETEYSPVPEGEFPMAVKAGSTKIISGIGKDGEPYRLYTSRAVIDSEEARKATNLEAPTARIRFFLDLNEAGNGLASGKNKNVALGRLLKATGNDKSGWSYAAIEGVPFTGQVKHTADKNDASRVFADVVAFAKL
jgi:hypothetical protein